ncbi:F0F1 ATP synthase subunit B [Isosphaeraceae bacterium EP7]
MSRLSNLALALMLLGVALAPARPARAQAADGHSPAAIAKHASDEVAHAEATAHTAVAEHAAAAEAKSPNILAVQLPLAVWTAVVFLGLLAVLGKFAWKPLMTAMHQREEHLEHVLLDTEKARNASEQLLLEHKRLMDQVAQQHQAILVKARQEAEVVANDIVQKAQAEAEASKVRAQRDISTARDEALDQIWTKTADLAVSVAGKVLSRSIGDDDHRRLVEMATNELPAANGHGGHS